MTLPEDFVRLMHEHYDKVAADSLCEALETTDPEVSIRLNPRKISAEEALSHNPDLEPVPWCPDAFYLKERPAFTFDPLLHAGAYYVQEASSMYIAQVLKGQGARSEGQENTNNLSKSPAPCSLPLAPNPLLALDLCAAPGGKSTLLQSLLPEGSLLISNK